MPPSLIHRSAAEDLSAQHELDRALLRWGSVPLMTMFIAICSQIAIPTMPLGIPITMQTLGVLLCAMALGPKLGMASLLLYLVMGVVGVGVFAEGQAGWGVLLGQSGGYIVGFIACQPVAHALIRRRDGSIRGWLALFLAGIGVHLVVFAFGVPWLYIIHRLDEESIPLTMGEAFHYGFVVFVPGLLLKSGIAAGIAARFLPSVARRLW